MSDSLRPHGLQHARLPCPSSTPRACLNSCPSSQWCHPAISSSVVPFSSCPQSFPASGSFPVSRLFASGGQSIGASASASVLPMNIQDWSPLGWTVGSSCRPGDSQESSPTPQFKSINSSALSFLYSPNLTSICDYWESYWRKKSTLGTVSRLLSHSPNTDSLQLCLLTPCGPPSIQDHRRASTRLSTCSLLRGSPHPMAVQRSLLPHTWSQVDLPHPVETSLLTHSFRFQLKWCCHLASMGGRESLRNAEASGSGGVGDLLVLLSYISNTDPALKWQGPGVAWFIISLL